MDNSKPKYYLTTPIYYANSRPHVGSAYTTIVCDVIARYKRMCGYDVAYLTGTDEHGVNIERAAEKPKASRRRSSSTRTKRFSAICGSCWELRITDFIRTTSADHARAVQTLVLRTNATKSPERHLQSANTRAATASTTSCMSATRPSRPIARSAAALPNWSPKRIIFSGSRRIRIACLSFTQEHPQFVQPDFRLNEVRAFVESGLKDISISRKTIKWGIPWPGDPEHVFYVWYDALTSYMSGIGYGRRRRIGEREVCEILARRPAHDREGNHPLPRGLLAGVLDGRRTAAAEENFRARLAAFRAGKDEQVEGQRRLSRADRESAWATTRCATTCCAKSSSARTAISRATR